MKNHKWFWITFGTWCFIAAVGAWALIFSPPHWDSKKISDFSLQVNGAVETHQIRVGGGSIAKTLDTMSAQWEQAGWRQETGNLNLASLMMNIPQEYEKSMASLIQLRLFKNKDSFRILGLLKNLEDGQTYQWIAEVPKTAVQSQKPSEVDFPLKPNSDAYDIFTVKTEKMETILWTLPSYQRNPENRFIDNYVSQGFSGRLWRRQPGESAYLLQKGSLRLFGIISPGEKTARITLVKLNKI